VNAPAAAVAACLESSMFLPGLDLMLIDVGARQHRSKLPQPLEKALFTYDSRRLAAFPQCDYDPVPGQRKGVGCQAGLSGAAHRVKAL